MFKRLGAMAVGAVALVGFAGAASGFENVPAATAGCGVGASGVPVCIGEPAEVARCVEGSTMWRIFGHLVIALEACQTPDLSGADTLVLLMDDGGDPMFRCDGAGGRFELIGSRPGFHLSVCWDVDF